MQAFSISGGQPRWTPQNDEPGTEMNGASKAEHGQDGQHGAHTQTAQSIIEEDPKPPPMSLFRLFQVFLWFGMRAFGGPVAQINMMKQELVVEQKWTTIAKFNRVLAVYQILPG
jgi:hypothetical protein